MDHQPFGEEYADEPPDMDLQEQGCIPTMAGPSAETSESIGRAVAAGYEDPVDHDF